MPFKWKFTAILLIAVTQMILELNSYLFVPGLYRLDY